MEVLKTVGMGKVALHLVIIVEPCATYHPWPITKTNFIKLLIHKHTYYFNTLTYILFIYTLDYLFI